MSQTKNNLSETLKRIDSSEESKEGELLNTIVMPRNIGQITDRLPKPQYNSEKSIKMKRNSSEPGRIGVIVASDMRGNLQSARNDNVIPLRGALVPIAEIEEPRSADPVRDYAGRNKNIYDRYRMRN